LLDPSVRPILVTGFGPFLDVGDNPSGALARAVDGEVVAGVPIVGVVLPVSYRRGPPQVLALCARHRPRFVVGLGVARQRARVTVERLGRRALGPTPDVDGAAPSGVGDGPEIVAATLDPERLAALLGADLSDDAGGYVCNAWAWEVPLRSGAPAAFVHVPPAGLPVADLLAALGALVAYSGSGSGLAETAMPPPSDSSSPK
jgi:pyroglutamyl-peptidase